MEFTRFVGAVSIVVYHFGTAIYPFSDPFLNKIFSSGNLAVSYFFTLSGYVATLSHYRRTPESTFGWGEYMIRKVVRIYPIYLLTLIVVLLFQILSHPELADFNEIALNLFLLQAWVPECALSLNSPSWALSVLVFFGAIFPFVLKCLENLSNARLLIVISMVWCLSLITHILLLKTIDMDYPSDSHNFIFYNPLMHFNAFLFGIGARMLFVRWRVVMGRVQPLLVSTAALCIIIIVMMGCFPQILKYSHNGLLAPVFVLLLIGLSADASAVSKVLSKKPFVVFGGVSYCIYMLQSPVHMFVYDVFKRGGFLNGFDSLRFLIFWSCLIALGFISYYKVELRVLELMRKKVFTGH